MINTGQYKHRIQYYSKSLTDGDWGETESWSVYKSKRCRAWQLTTVEKNSKMGLQTQTAYQFRQRYDASITTEMRILFDGSYYEIAEILLVDDNKREMIVKAYRTI